jgi:hypothetical protein
VLGALGRDRLVHGRLLDLAEPDGDLPAQGHDGAHVLAQREPAEHEVRHALERVAHQSDARGAELAADGGP